MRPRGAVEALDDAAGGGGGPVPDPDGGQGGASGGRADGADQLGEGLRGVEGSGPVRSGQDDAGSAAGVARGEDVPAAGQPPG
ncbi:hypothetical protein GCM10020295_24440 [Streptomyces cinereospinus]